MEKNWNDKYDANFKDLTGKTLKEINGGVGGSTMIFTTDCGEVYQLEYYPDCCASCSIEDICGDLSDLIGTPILLAEEVCSHEPDAETLAKRAKKKAEIEAKDGYYYEEDSETWVFYKLSTINGSVTIRWYGSSNGYYSESATFERLA